MNPPANERRSRWNAIVKRRCPRCLKGPIYATLFKPLQECPVCGLVYEREPGYFLGSFYISYGLGAAVGLPAAFVALYSGLSFFWLFPLVGGWVGLLSPVIVTYARTLWYHLDQLADPR
jgi:uncharacterized protein (DUF983 family)